MARLRDRLPELEADVLNRIGTIGTHSSQIDDPEYRDGQCRAVRTALKFGIDTVEVGERRAGDAPVTLLSQARLAARHGVGVGVVHRRYLAGKHVLARALRNDASKQNGLRVADLESLLSSLEVVFDRLARRIEEEYEHEASLCPSGPRDRLTERVTRLLAGEPIDTSDLPYNFDGHHIGAVADGEDAGEAIRLLAKELDARPLIAYPGGNTVWAWLGTRRSVCRQQLSRTITSCWPPTTPVGVGEPDSGLGGWRVSHRQAKAVAPTARRRGARIARYADDAIAAAVERDALLVASLHRLYREPLECDPDRLLDLPGTLRAYLDAGRNCESAASVLGVSRRTVSNRLRRVEERLGSSLAFGTADIEIALRLGEDDRAP